MNRNAGLPSMRAWFHLVIIQLLLLLHSERRKFSVRKVRDVYPIIFHVSEYYDIFCNFNSSLYFRDYMQIRETRYYSLCVYSLMIYILFVLLRIISFISSFEGKILYNINAVISKWCCKISHFEFSYVIHLVMRGTLTKGTLEIAERNAYDPFEF